MKNTKSKKNIERMKRDAENLVESSKDAFVDYFNDITDKVQDYTADKLEKIEKKTKQVLENTKASSQNQARTINNMVSKNNNEFKNTTDTLLFK